MFIFIIYWLNTKFIQKKKDMTPRVAIVDKLISLCSRCPVTRHYIIFDIYDGRRCLNKIN